MQGALGRTVGSGAAVPTLLAATSGLELVSVLLATSALTAAKVNQ